MPRVNGSWVGTQQQPTFRTYQTAGMLQPAAAPASTAPPPTTSAPITPMPILTPTQPPGTDGGVGAGPIFDINVGNTPGGLLGTSITAPDQSVDDGRARLAQAILGQTMGGSTRGVQGLSVRK